MIIARPAETLLFRIQSETRDLHQRLERNLDFFGPDFTLAGYRKILAGFYGFYANWERNLEPWSAQLASRGIAFYPRTPNLIRDLAFFSLDCSQIDLCSFVPRLVGLPEAMGSLYVREGSALGGQIISRQIESRLGLSGGAGYQFFSNVGRNVGQEWRTFREVLLACSSPEDDAKLIASARGTFDAIRIWLCRDR